MTTIHSRASWGARYRNGVGNRRVGNLEVYFHHTVTATLSANATLAQERAQMRVIEGIGQQRFGAGMSYTFVVFPSGRVHEGAGVGRIAYHSGAGRNVRGAAICLAGNYDRHDLPAPMRNGVAWLLRRGVARGWWRRPRITELHRQFRGTACPGRHGAAAVPDIHRRADAGVTIGAEMNKEQDARLKRIDEAIRNGKKGSHTDGVITAIIKRIESQTKR